MSAVEDLIRAGKLETTQIERLHGSYQKALETPSMLASPGTVSRTSRR